MSSIPTVNRRLASCSDFVTESTRFIWREAIASILIWLIVLPAVQVFGNHGHLLSLQFAVIWLIMLPIFLLGGYLTGSWEWKDLEKKYPE